MADRTLTTATPPGRVLVVDDEQPLAQMVASYLIRAGFDTRQAHTGTQAVDEARRFSPDVVVLDLGLPELDGLDWRCADGSAPSRTATSSCSPRVAARTTRSAV